nr:hypothetical protein BaRGS_014997 [Batillaria attramentaria]
MDALVAVIRTLGWTEMTLVYDKNEEMAAKELSLGLSALAGHTHLQSYDVSMILGEPTTVSRSGEDDELFHFLNEIYVRRSAEMRMVLLCSVACNMRVLTAWPTFIERDGKGGYVGICVDLLNQLKASLNFSYEWTEPADQEWGRLTENNTWTGLVGLLERQEVDLVVAPLSIQAERERVMDFIHPFYLDYTTVLLKRPDPDESNWRRLIQPFKPQHLAKVKAGKYAYIGEMSTMLLFLKSECDLFIIKEQFLPLQYAVGLVNDSAYTSVFSDE